MKVKFIKMQSLFHNIKDNIKNNNIPLDFKLFLFLSVLVLTIIIGILVVLFAVGVFTAGLSEHEKIFTQKLNHVTQDVAKQYGNFSQETISFSNNLSKSIENNAIQLGISLEELGDKPEVLAEIIGSEFNHVLLALQKAKSSGAFFILDATINPRAENASFSKAGLYIKNIEPNIISSSSPTISTLRGLSNISRKNSIPLDAHWSMEFDVSDAPYYQTVMEMANRNGDLPLSCLYYWTPLLTLPNTTEEVMLCSLPLIDSKGNVFGVCGLEVSSMLFKLTHMSINNMYERQFSLLSPIDGNIINFDDSIMAGSYAARLMPSHNKTLLIENNRKSLYSYKDGENAIYLGLHTPINLYPKGSAFADEEWAVAVMVPETDILTSIAKLNRLLIFWLVILFLAGIVISFYLSQRFTKPITESFDTIISSDLCELPKTNILEINDLIDYLAAHNDELYDQAVQNNFSLSMLDEFVKNTATLSPAERTVFDLYVQGHSAQESAQALSLSINTIKTHNKNIYSKLNISSREELILYVKMLQEIGIDF